MFSAAVLDHFANPRNAGELPAPAAHAEMTNPVCGDILSLWIHVDSGRLREIRFKAKGCVAAIACGSAVTELAKGKPLAEAAQLTPDHVVAALGGLPPESGHAAELAVAALQSALRAALNSSG
ncbi:MAG TPA: iron-sulfur cluster assembly scaffold protein [Terriglobia bacterium]|nr:iron-sulfur cluster assembly scaffold protein [Terriglobia bacterium]